MKIDKFIGYCSMLLLQANSIPTLLADHVAISALTPMFTIAGLSGYLFYSIKNRIVLYSIGNIVGIVFSLCLLLKVLL